MANNRCTYQMTETVSVKREKLLDIATNIEMSKNEYKIFMVLLTQLEGYSIPKTYHASHKDPLNFKIIDIEAISDLLYISEKKVKKAIKQFNEDGIIEEGSNDTISHGYRFTF